MTKLETINAAQAIVTTKQAELQDATFALRDALNLPADPTPKLWRLRIQPNRNAAGLLQGKDVDGNWNAPVSLDIGGCLGSAIAPFYPGVSQAPVAGDGSLAEIEALERPAPVLVIYTAGCDEKGIWSYDAPVSVEWTEVAAL